MEMQRLKSILESLIFTSEKPLKLNEMWKALVEFDANQEGAPSSNSPAQLTLVPDPDATSAVEDGDAALQQIRDYATEQAAAISKEDIRQALAELQRDYEDNPDRGIAPVEVAHGWKFRTKVENAEVLRFFYPTKPTKLSKPSIETLSIIAYRQPLTRPEIDEIRGVDSGGVLRTLLEKDLVRIVGKKEEAGKPVLYGTTQSFLELFQLKSLKDLPSLRDYQDLEAEFQRRSGEEGTVVANETGPMEEESSLLSLAGQAELGYLDEEEEGMLAELESSLKDLRHLEKEMFPEETPTPPNPPQN